MATLPVQTPNAAGVLGFNSASVAGDDFPNDERTLLIVQATAGTPTITIPAQRANVTVPNFGTLAVDDIVVAMGGTGINVMQASPGGYNNNTNGRAEVNTDTAGGTRYRCVRLNKV